MVTRLRLGRQVEQWLGAQVEDYGRVLRFLVIEPQRHGGFTIRGCEVLDVGRDDLVDVYAFPSADPENPDGTVYEATSELQAIDVAVSEFGAVRSRFVNQGMVQDEYREARGSWSGPTEAGEP